MNHAGQDKQLLISLFHGIVVIMQPVAEPVT